MSETALTFECGGQTLMAICHHGDALTRRGVLLVVGGPQYRVGSHRQFVLLARFLAKAGVPVLRFDYRGMGDSQGEMRSFEHVHDDIHAAVETFTRCCPQLREVVIWGLCDAASAGLFYAHHDPRVAGLVLLNPWVRTQAGEAKAYLKTYYSGRLLNRGFWRKVLKGELNYRQTLRSLTGFIRKAAGGTAPPGEAVSTRSLPDRMAEGMARFAGPVLLILSGNDLTAAEFKTTAKSSPAWRGLLAQPHVTLHEMPEANHTFSRNDWRDEVAEHTLDWLRSW